MAQESAASNVLQKAMASGLAGRQAVWDERSEASLASMSSREKPEKLWRSEAASTRAWEISSGNPINTTEASKNKNLRQLFWGFYFQFLKLNFLNSKEYS